jgi:death on curing protein
MRNFTPLPTELFARIRSCISASPDALSHAGRNHRLGIRSCSIRPAALRASEILELESALAQPRATFGGTDLHVTLVQKAAALGFSLTLNHPFVDGNKRAAHAAMEVFLMLNSLELIGTVDEHERLMLDLADGRISREHLATWIEQRVKPVDQ